MHPRTTRLAPLLLLAIAPATNVRAQDPALVPRDSISAQVPRRPVRLVPSPREAPTLDERVRDWWQRPERQQATALRVGFRAADLAASPGTVIAPPLVWAYASATEAVGPARGARRTTEAVLLGAATTQALKLAFGRARPGVHGRSDDWAWWRGDEGGRYQAFPSGHTTVAAAAAATWIAESRGSVPVVAGAVTFAAGAGLARMFLDRHWLTDVLAGAAVGTASALAVQALHRR